MQWNKLSFDMVDKFALKNHFIMDIYKNKQK